MARVPSQRAKKEDDFGLGCAEEDAGEHLGCGGFGLEVSLADDDAFTRGEAVGFDDNGDGEAEELFADLIERGADGVGSGGNLMALHELFSEGLARLELSCGLGGAEHTQFSFLQLVDDAEGEWNFGADDGQVGPFHYDEIDHGGEVV
jgi:hypothetical protein